VLHDVETGDRHIPLDTLTSNGSRLIINNSNLSEAAVLGFEYGYSSVDPDRLVIWEAQFGDFCNTAQVIIDQFIASAETKWTRSSALVMLLPHGYEGQGPEHSSARLERFLQLCAEDNMQVCNLTTPAQYFHALRRQIHRSYRKPLVVMSPKSLLRHPRATSSIEEFERGGFQRVIDDDAFASERFDRADARRIIICSGKVYYTLLAAREETAFDDVALVRLEQLHPFPFAEVRDTLSAYSTEDIVWCQEEPWNMGAWTYVQERMRRALSPGVHLRYVGRSEAASPATGSFTLHDQEETEFVREAFAKKSRERTS
jgi:2-oxoglutarate dehydrogenase E1 component